MQHTIPVLSNCDKKAHLWLRIRRPGVRIPALPEKKVVGLERGPPSLVNTTEELLDRKVAAPV
jgi:hypothetical protein